MRTKVWDSVGSKEQFLCLTVAIWEALQGIGPLKKHKEAEDKVLEVKEELKQARESRGLTKQQVKVCESETEKEPLRWELATLETPIKACKATVASAKSNQIATMASIFSTAMATIFYPEMVKLRGTNSHRTNRKRQVDGPSQSQTQRYTRQKNDCVRRLHDAIFKSSLRKQRGRRHEILHDLPEKKQLG
jgi:hypothetical protein